MPVASIFDGDFYMRCIISMCYEQLLKTRIFPIYVCFVSNSTSTDGVRLPNQACSIEPLLRLPAPVEPYTDGDSTVSGVLTFSWQ